MPASKDPEFYTDIAAALDLALAATEPIVYELTSPGMVTNFIQRTYSFRKAIRGLPSAIRYRDIHVTKDKSNPNNVLIGVRKLAGTFKDAQGNVLTPREAPMAVDPMEEEARKLFEDLGDLNGLT